MKRLSKFATTALAVGTLSGILAGVPGGLGATIPAKAATLPKGVHLTVWSWWGGPERVLLQNTANAWGKLHGDTVTVIDKSADGQFQDFATAARSGSGPDMAVGIPHDNLGQMQLEGVLAPVPAGTINTKAYLAQAISAATLSGRMYAVPLAAETYALFYRTNKVQTAPSNWTQFIAAAKAKGFEYGDTNFYFSYAFLGGFGGYVFGPSSGGGLNAKNIGLANAGSIKGLSLIRDFIYKYRFMSPTFNTNFALTDFQSGKTGLYISGPWDVAGLQKAKVPFKVAPLPLLPNGHHPQTFEGFQTEVVNSKSANQALDWSLAQYIARTTPVKELQVGSRLPVITSIINSSVVSKDPITEAFAQALKFGTPMPNIPAMGAVWTPAGNALQFVATGKETPAAAAKQMVSNIQKGIALQ